MSTADQPTPPVEQLDPVDSLTVVELRVINGKLKADAMKAITDGTADRWDALALVAWVLAKRRDPAARLSTYENMTIGQLGDLLPDDDDDQVDEGPRTVADLEGEATADPLGPSR